MSDVLRVLETSTHSCFPIVDRRHKLFVSQSKKKDYVPPNRALSSHGNSASASSSDSSVPYNLAGVQRGCGTFCGSECHTFSFLFLHYLFLSPPLRFVFLFPSFFSRSSESFSFLSVSVSLSAILRHQLVTLLLNQSWGRRYGSTVDAPMLSYYDFMSYYVRTKLSWRESMSVCVLFAHAMRFVF